MDPREWRDLTSGMFGGQVSSVPEGATEVEPPPVDVSAGRDPLVPLQPTTRREDLDALGPGEALSMVDRLSCALSEATEADEVLRTLGRWAMSVSRPLASLVDRVTAEGLMRAASNGDPHVAGMLISEAGTEAGYLGAVVTTGSAHWSPDFLQDLTARPWHAAAAVSGVRSAATVPIRVGGDVSALLTVLWSRRYAAGDEVRTLLTVAADLAAARCEALAALEQSDRFRLRYAAAASDVIRLHEVECARIAGAIYDGSLQFLAALDLEVGLLRQRVASVTPQLDEPVSRVHDLVHGATEGLRELLTDLEPDVGEVGFELLVQDAVHQVFEHTDVDTDVDAEVDSEVDSEVRDAPADTVVMSGYLGSAERSQGLRIVREILLDARERPHLTRVEVAIRRRHAGIEVRVQDDGATNTATNPDLPRRRRSTAQLRAALVGGTFMTTTSDGGTEARLWLPLRAVGHGPGEAARGKGQEPDVAQGSGA